MNQKPRLPENKSKNTRDQLLAKALRDNLRRRKAGAKKSATTKPKA